MTNRTEQIESTLASWLDEHYTIEEYQDRWIIGTPHLDRHDDFVEVTLMNAGGELRITDSGESMAELGMSGMNLTEARMRHVQNIVIRFGLRFDQNEIWTPVHGGDIGDALQRLLQGMSNVQEIDDLSSEMLGTTQELQAVVGEALADSGLSFESRVKLRGASQIEYQADFLIERGTSWPDYIISTRPRLNLAAAKEQILFALDTREQYRVQVGADPIYLSMYEVMTKRARTPLECYGIGTLSLDEVHALDWDRYLRDSCRSIGASDGQASAQQTLID